MVNYVMKNNVKENDIKLMRSSTNKFFKQINLDKGHKYITYYNFFTFEIKDIKKWNVIHFFHIV
jgi:hypothetical protein